MAAEKSYNIENLFGSKENRNQMRFLHLLTKTTEIVIFVKKNTSSRAIACSSLYFLLKLVPGKTIVGSLSMIEIPVFNSIYAPAKLFA